jgi:leucyl-tRNA synthetase
VMHLLYARFWTKVLYDEGLVPVEEPFQVLRNQGQVLGRTPYRLPRPGEKLEIGEDAVMLTKEEAAQMPEEEVHWRWVRMSKSKGNVVTPDEAVAEYGADALRLHELFVAPFEADVQWSNEGMNGTARFLSRVFKLASELEPDFEAEWRDTIGSADIGEAGTALRRATHKAIQTATEDIARFSFNTYVATLMKFLNAISDARKALTEPNVALSEALETLILLLAPGAPHSADELWESLGFSSFTFDAEWPTYDPALAKSETATIAIQVNGKLRDTIEMPAEASEEELREAALASAKVTVHTEGKSVRKIIVVPGKLVNVVVG